MVQQYRIKKGGQYTMAKNENRPNIPLVCTECKHENYVTEKNKKNTTEKLELKKFCKWCNKTTVHKEKKQY